MNLFFEGSNRFRRRRWYNSNGTVAMMVLITYLLYKTATLRLPRVTESLTPLSPEIPRQLMVMKGALPVRDVLSVKDASDEIDNKTFSYLNLGNWNTSHVLDVNGDHSDIGVDIIKHKNKETTLSKAHEYAQYGEEGKGIDFVKQVQSSQMIVARHDFKYILNPETLCKDPDLFFIIYIHTAAKYRERRDVIRRTWGNPEGHTVNFKLIFVLGIQKEKNETQENEIREEYNKYGDILQEDFIDTYHNLTHKGVAALKWIDQYCNHVKFVLKTDDDTFVNMFTYIRYIKAIYDMGIDHHNIIMCAVWNGMTVSRKGKWAVTREDFNATSYPMYCSGCAFTFSIDVARAIHRVSYYVPFFWVDDAYITGILPRRIGKIKYKNSRSIYELNSDKLIEKFNGSEWWRYIFSSDIHRFKEAEDVWNKLKIRAKNKWTS